MVCVHVTCASWFLSNRNSSSCSWDKNSLRPFSPEKFELPVSGSQLTDRARVAACPLCRVGGVPRAQSPSPACPPPPPALASLSPTQGRDRQRLLQRPDDERSFHQLAWSWVHALGRVLLGELECLERGKLSPLTLITGPWVAGRSSRESLMEETALILPLRGCVVSDKPHGLWLCCPHMRDCSSECPRLVTEFRKALPLTFACPLCSWRRQSTLPRW